MLIAIPRLFEHCKGVFFSRRMPTFEIQAETIDKKTNCVTVLQTEKKRNLNEHHNVAI